MRCEALEEIVFSGREITAQERRAREEHARHCAACRALLEQEDVLRGARALDADVEVPAQFSQRWRRAVRLTPQRESLTRRMAAVLDGHPRGRMAARLAAYACCAVVLVGVGAGLGGGRKSTPTVYGAQMRMSANSAAMDSFEEDAAYDMESGAGLAANKLSAASGAQEERKILRTAQLDVRTSRFDEALDALRGQTAARGGSVTSCDVWGKEGTVRSATLELSIPEGELDGFDFVVNTVPARVLTDAMLCCLSEGALLLELASPPGGFDRTLAENIGVKVLAAPGLPGKSAPYSAAALIRDAVYQIIREQEE